MTDLEELRIVKRYLGKVMSTEESSVTYQRVCKRIMELEKPEEDLKERAERAEADLSEAQDRALRFEKMLKAEEARKDVEPVLDIKRVFQTMLCIGDAKTDKSNECIFNPIYWLLKEAAERIGISEVAFSRNPYKWK